MTTYKQKAQQEAAAGAARQRAVPAAPEPVPEEFNPMKDQLLVGQQRVYDQNTQTYTLAYETSLVTVRLTAKDKDVHGNARARYDRAWKACKDAAVRLATHTNTQVPYPAWVGPPTAKEEDMILAEPAAFDSGHYVETKGMGPSGKGGPVPNFAGDNSEWLSVQGVGTNKAGK